MNQIKYTIFKTKWGYFGLAASKKGLIRTILPLKSRPDVQKRLLDGLKDAQYDPKLLRDVQKQIIEYFEGKAVKFDAPIGFDSVSPFTHKVLWGCAKIPAGKTVSYSQLANTIGSPRAGRAVGSALSKNPVPLIIPCHRVVHADGSLGNFSAPGGTTTKKKLLELEECF